MSTPQLSQVQDPTMYGETTEDGAAVEGTHDPVGMRVTPEVTLFVGGAIVSIVLIAVMLVFWWKASKQEREAEKERTKPRAGGGAGGNA